jgi:hypothetical protein
VHMLIPRPPEFCRYFLSNNVNCVSLPSTSIYVDFPSVGQSCVNKLKLFSNSSFTDIIKSLS